MSFHNMTGISQCEPVAPPRSEIEQRVYELEQMVQQFQAIAQGFNASLQPALKPQMANEAKQQATPKPVVAPLTGRLDTILTDLRSVANVLNDIHDRIAL